MNANIITDVKANDTDFAAGSFALLLSQQMNLMFLWWRLIN